MISRILMTASIAALISVAPAAADTTTKKKLPEATQGTTQTGTSQSGQSGSGDQSGTNMQTGQTQDNTNAQTGQASEDQNTLKKKKANQTGQTQTQSGQKTKTGEATGEQGVSQKKKKKTNQT